MISALDEMLWHQLPTTMDHVGTSDPRFFDRFWFAAYAPDGSAALQLTIGVYRNMNVIDAGLCVIVGGTQHNLRASCSLDGATRSWCGPIGVDVRSALEHLFLQVLPNESGILAELDWTAIAGPIEEVPHFQRKRGRVVEEYCRYNQIGRASGWIDVAGTRIEVDDWWACRDHSWGVRPRIGIREPRTGKVPSLADRGFTMAFLFFSTEQVAGTLLFMQREGEAAYTSGAMEYLASGDTAQLSDIAIFPVLEPGTRRFQTVRIDAMTDGGDALRFECRRSGSAFALKGLGYSGGYDDGRGLGVWRAPSLLEHERWDVADPSKILYPDGRADDHWHRIQPVTLDLADLNGASRGEGSMTLILSGPIPALGLE